MRHLGIVARFLSVFVLLALYALELRAQESPGSAAGCSPTDAAEPGDLALALAIAKVAANEASLVRMRPAEVALIHQVAEGHGSTSAERLRWLRAHSSCVLTDRPLRESELDTNCRWTRHLEASDDEPEGWPGPVPWSRFAPRWEQVRAYALLLVTGRRRSRPCPITPSTWGSRRIDMEQALERGLVPVGCVDPQTGLETLNEGFVLARRRR